MRDEEIEKLKKVLQVSQKHGEYWFDKSQERDLEILELKKELKKRWERIERLAKEIEDYKKDNTNLVKLLFLHRRFHTKVGCPGEDECYVCKEDNE